MCLCDNNYSKQQECSNKHNSNNNDNHNNHNDIDNNNDDFNNEKITVKVSTSVSITKPIDIAGAISSVLSNKLNLSGSEFDCSAATVVRQHLRRLTGHNTEKYFMLYYNTAAEIQV